MKKFFKIIGYLFLGIFGLLLLGLIILSFTGFPKPEQFEVRNIKKASLGQISDILPLMSSQPVHYKLIRSEDNKVYFTKNGQPLMLNLDSTKINPTDKFIPRAGLFGHLQYQDGYYYFLEENFETGDRALMKMQESTGKKDTLLLGDKGFYDFQLSPDGNEIAVIDHVDSTGYNNIYMLQKTNEPEIIFSSGEIMALQTFGPDNSFIIVNEIKVGGEVNYYKLDVKNGELIAYESKPDSISHYLSNTSRVITATQAFSQDFKISYFIRTGTESLAKEFNVLYEKRGDSIKQISPEMAADVGHLELSPDDRFVVFTANSGGFGKIYSYDRMEDELKAIFEDEEFNLNWFNNKPFLLTETNQILYSTSNFSGSKFMLSNLNTGISQVLDSGIQEGLKNSMQFVKFTYPTTDDSIGIMTGINAYLYKPTSAPFDKLPVVIDLHGGPSMPAFPYQFSLGNYFINKGIAVIAPDFRGSAGYGIGFESADNVLNRPKQVEDIKSLLEWIKTQPDLDGEKVMLMGQSHGGYMVMASLAQYPGEFLGGISIAGVSDFSLVKHENNYHSQGLKYEFGDFKDPLLKSSIDSISPLTHASRITEPLMLMHGTADETVVYENSSKMADAIEESGGEVRYLQANGYGHGVQPQGPSDGFYMLSATFDFIEYLIEK